MVDIHSEIARAQQRPSITQVLERMQPDIAKALPKGLDPDRVTRLALTVIRQSEMAKAKGTAKTSLADCTPESFAGALLTAVAFGLEPGVDGEAWLVPYGRECTFIPGYKGIAKLFWQHPLARHLDAQAVYENDEFDYALGLNPYLTHKPARTDRGTKITHYYAVASLSTGAQKFEVMTAEEVAAVRDASPRRSNDIRDPQHWMERKTVLKQLLKVMPKSTRLQQALVADEQSGTELQAQQMPTQIVQTNPVAIESAPAGVDPVTGEVVADGYGDVSGGPYGIPADQADPQPAQEASPDSGVRGGRAEEVTPQPSGERRRSSRARGDQAGGTGEGGGEAPDPVAADRPKLTNKQRSALMARWAELGIQRGDRDERLLITCTLLGLEPGALKSTSDLSAEDAGRLLDVLNEVSDRDDLDRRISGQAALTGGEQ